MCITKCCIIDCKMAHAKKLIDSGFENVGGIAQAVGFKDALYFSKSFKKHFGVPPSEYITKLSMAIKKCRFLAVKKCMKSAFRDVGLGLLCE